MSSVRIKDLWVLNTPNAHTINVRLTVDQIRPSNHGFINGLLLIFKSLIR